MGAINLHEKISELRDQINESICYKQGAWERKQNDDWNKLWTAIDNIEDTQSAIEEFASLNELSWLAIFGLLQSMFVQQDSIGHLEKSINIPTPDWKKVYPALSNIRDIRNETIGHPISLKNGTFVSISHTKSLNILEYGIWSKKGFEHKKVNLKEIIKVQNKLLVDEVERIMKKINEDEAQHKRKFKNKSLLKLFHHTSYHIQKLWSFERSREYSKSNFESLKSTYENFQNEVKQRYMLDTIDEQGVQIPGLINTIQHVEKILPRIEKMVMMESTVDPLDLDVYVESLDDSFKDLRKMAKEIDDEFKNQL